MPWYGWLLAGLFAGYLAGGSAILVAVRVGMVLERRRVVSEAWNTTATTQPRSNGT